MTVQLLQGNCLDTLKTLEPNSVQCVVTSPPYYGLRDYGTPPQIWGGDTDCVHDWQEYIQPAANGITHDDGMTGETLSGNSATRKPKKSDFCSICGAWRGNFGLEPSPELFVEHMVLIFREVRRVLKDDGTLWLNLGDSYAGGASGLTRDGLPNDLSKERGHGRSAVGMTRKRPPVAGLKTKDLIGIPWMVAFALRADGWYLRQDIIWHKPNPMPESVTDRCTKAHEYIFLLSKSARYYYDAEAIQEPSVEGNWEDRIERQSIKTFPTEKVNGIRSKYSFARAVNEEPPPGKSNQHRTDREDVEYSGKRNKRDVWIVTTKPYKEAHFATFPMDLIEPCILAGSKEGDVVLDPFNGSGTTGAVSVKHRRNYIGCELNPEYIELTRKRLAKVQIVAPL